MLLHIVVLQLVGDPLYFSSARSGLARPESGMQSYEEQNFPPGQQLAKILGSLCWVRFFNAKRSEGTQRLGNTGSDEAAEAAAAAAARASWARAMPLSPILRLSILDSGPIPASALPCEAPALLQKSAHVSAAVEIRLCSWTACGVF